MESMPMTRPVIRTFRHSKNDESDACACDCACAYDCVCVCAYECGGHRLQEQRQRGSWQKQEGWQEQPKQLLY
jgi:hypothetical protein